MGEGGLQHSSLITGGDRTVYQNRDSSPLYFHVHLCVLYIWQQKCRNILHILAKYEKKPSFRDVINIKDKILSSIFLLCPPEQLRQLL